MIHISISLYCKTVKRRLGVILYATETENTKSITKMLIIDARRPESQSLKIVALLKKKIFR